MELFVIVLSPPKMLRVRRALYICSRSADNAIMTPHADGYLKGVTEKR